MLKIIQISCYFISTSLLNDNKSKLVPVTINSLTLWNRIPLEKLVVAQEVKKFPAFYGTRSFITVIIRVRHCYIPWARWI